MWPLFFIPWAATVLSVPLGFVVTSAFVYLHYTYKKPVLQAIEMVARKNLLFKPKEKDAETKNDSEAAGGEQTQPRQGSQKVEADEPPSTGSGNARSTAPAAEAPMLRPFPPGSIEWEAYPMTHDEHGNYVLFDLF